MNCFEEALARDGITQTQSMMVREAQKMAKFASDICPEEEFCPLLLWSNEAIRATKMNGAVMSVQPLFAPGMERFRGPGLARILREQEADFYLLGSEAWTLPQEATRAIAESQGKLSPESIKDLELERPIREDDRRISVLMINGESREGDVLMAVFRIDEGNGRAVDLEKPEIFYIERKSKDVGSGGSLSGLLDKLEAAE